MFEFTKVVDYLFLVFYTLPTMLKTNYIRELFEINGESIAQWSRRHGFSPALVYRVLRGDTTAKRGQTHEIAVALGIKRLPTEAEKILFSSGPCAQFQSLIAEEREM